VCGCSRDRNEEQNPGLRRSSVERYKEGDGFVRFRWGETEEQGAGGGARLAIEIGADFPIGITDGFVGDECRVDAAMSDPALPS
jgi:hypothetical protein